MINVAVDHIYSYLLREKYPWNFHISDDLEIELN